MTQKYTINLTDPFSDSFYITEYTSNGPVFPISTLISDTATSANTSFVVYGKGHPNYGERLQENILHLLENFSGSIEPSYPTSGQLWFTRYDHIKTDSGWFKWNDDTSNWDIITPSATQPSLTNGVYWIDGTILKQGVVQANHPLNSTYVTRKWRDLTGSVSNPNSISLTPEKTLQSYNGQEWSSVSSIYVDRVSPLGTQGKLWYDELNTILKVYVDGTGWIESGNYLNLNGGTMAGTLDLGGFSIINLADPTNSSDAATRGWVLTQISGTVSAINDLSDVNVVVPTPNGAFMRWDIGTNNWIEGTISLSDVSGVTATPVEVNYLSGVTSNVQTQIDTKLNKSGGILTGSLNINNQIVSNVKTPVDPNDATNKQYVDDEIAAVSSGSGGTEIHLSSASLDSVIGSGTEGYLTLTMSDATDITVAGFSVQGHDHNASAITYQSSDATLLSELSTPPTDVSSALYAIDNIIKKRTSPRRAVYTTTSTVTILTNIPEFEAGTNKLFVYLDGLKQIASTRGFDSVIFSTPPNPSSTTGLDSGTNNYTFDINVDGAGATTVTIDGANAQTFFELVSEINTQLSTLTIDAVAVFEDGEILVYSDSSGSTSTVVLADSGVNQLFSSLTNFSSITGGLTGVDYEYTEDGSYGETIDQITMTSSVVSGHVFEYVVISDSGIY